MEKMFFMHIAKAAGSSINKMFEDALGEDLCVNHIERFPDMYSGVSLEDKRFVSGHVFNENWKLIEGSVGFKKITILRDPLKHLASHIQWLDSYNEKRDEFNILHPDTQELVKMIDGLDISSPRELDHLLVNLPPIGMQFFDNCQSRYFIKNTLKNRGNAKLPMTLMDTPALMRAYEEFDVIGVLENLEKTIEVINKKFNLSLSKLPYENRHQKGRKIDTTNKMINQILSKRLTVDKLFYNKAVEKLKLM